MEREEEKRMEENDGKKTSNKRRESEIMIKVEKKRERKSIAR